MGRQETDTESVKSSSYVVQLLSYTSGGMAIGPTTDDVGFSEFTSKSDERVRVATVRKYVEQLVMEKNQHELIRFDSR